MLHHRSFVGKPEEAKRPEENTTKHAVPTSAGRDPRCLFFMYLLNSPFPTVTAQLHRTSFSGDVWESEDSRLETSLQWLRGLMPSLLEHRQSAAMHATLSLSREGVSTQGDRPVLRLVLNRPVSQREHDQQPPSPGAAPTPNPGLCTAWGVSQGVPRGELEEGEHGRSGGCCLWCASLLCNFHPELQGRAVLQGRATLGRTEGRRPRGGGDGQLDLGLSRHRWGWHREAQTGAPRPGCSLNPQPWACHPLPAESLCAYFVPSGQSVIPRGQKPHSAHFRSPWGQVENRLNVTGAQLILTERNLNVVETLPSRCPSLRVSYRLLAMPSEALSRVPSL